MVCPICGYALSAFDKTCPRCELLKQRANLTTSFSGPDRANVIVATGVPKGTKPYKTAIGLALFAIVAVSATIVWKSATERASATSTSLNNTGSAFAHTKADSATLKQGRIPQADADSEQLRSRYAVTQQELTRRNASQQQEVARRQWYGQQDWERVLARQQEQEQELARQKQEQEQELARQKQEQEQEIARQQSELQRQNNQRQKLQQLNSQIREYRDNLSKLIFASKMNYGVLSVAQVMSGAVNAPRSSYWTRRHERDPGVLTVAQANALAQRTVQLGNDILRNPLYYKNHHREPRVFSFFIPLNPMYPDGDSNSFEFLTSESLDISF